MLGNRQWSLLRILISLLKQGIYNPVVKDIANQVKYKKRWVRTLAEGDVQKSQEVITQAKKEINWSELNGRNN